MEQTLLTLDSDAQPRLEPAIFHPVAEDQPSQGPRVFALPQSTQCNVNLGDGLRKILRDLFHLISMIQHQIADQLPLFISFMLFTFVVMGGMSVLFAKWMKMHKAMEDKWTPDAGASHDHGHDDGHHHH